MTSQQILVIDDEPTVLTGITRLLTNAFPDHQVIPSLDSSTLAAVSAGDLVCLDFRLADGSWPTKLVQEAASQGAAVLIVTTGATPAELGECMRAGASGVVLKAELEESLAAAVATAINHGLVLNFSTAHALGILQSLLDPAEQRLLQLIGNGLSPQEAARQTGLGNQPISWLSQTMWTHLRDRLRDAPSNLARVCVVDNHPLSASGIAELLKAAIPAVQVSYESNIASLLASPRPFDLVLLDVLLEDGSDPTANARAAVQSGAAVALLTGVQPTTAAEVDLVAAAFGEGAQALMLKTDPPAEVMEALSEVMSGHMYINRSWAEVMRFQADQLARLTAAERKVFTLRREGLSRAEIAAVLVCSEENVKGHCRDIAQRLTADWTQRIRP